MVEIADWRTARSFHPVMTAHVAAPREVVVRSMATTVRRRRLRLGYEGEDGFRVTYRSWLDVLGWLELDFFGFTRLRVTAVPSGTGTSVTVAVEEDGALRGRTPCVAALTQAFGELERQGFVVTTTPWVAQN